MIDYNDFDFTTFCRMLDKKDYRNKSMDLCMVNGFISIYPIGIEFDTPFILNMAKKNMYIPESKEFDLQRAFYLFCKRKWLDKDCAYDMFNIFKICKVTSKIRHIIGMQSVAFIKVFLQSFKITYFSIVTLENVDYLCENFSNDICIYSIFGYCKKDNHNLFKKLFDYMCKIYNEICTKYKLSWFDVIPFLKYENNFNYVLNKCPNFMLKDLLQYVIDNDCVNYINTMLELPSFENILKSIKIITISPNMFDILFLKYGEKYFNDLHILKTMENCNHDYGMLFRLSMLNIFNMLEQPINSEWPNDDSSYIVKDKLLEVYEQDIKYKEHIIFLKN